MKAYLLPMILLVGTSQAFAQEDMDDLYGGGDETEEFKFERFSNESILVEIDKDARVNCDKEGLCTLTAITETSDKVTVSFEVGEGLTNNDTISGGYGWPAGYGTTGGGDTTSGEDFIPEDDSSTGGSSNSSDGIGWSVKVSYTHGRCTQKVKVPRSLYYAMNRYLYGLMNADGSTKRGFTPADEKMMLFYTTVLGRASGCGGGGSDLIE